MKNSFQLAAKQSLGLSRISNSNTNMSRHNNSYNNNYRLLQDVGNDKDYNMIINTKTTYLTQDGKQITPQQLINMNLNKEKAVSSKNNNNLNLNHQSQSQSSNRLGFGQQKSIYNNTQINNYQEQIQQQSQQNDYSQTSSYKNTKKQKDKTINNDKNQVSSITNLKPITNIKQQKSSNINTSMKSPIQSRISDNPTNSYNANNKIMEKGYSININKSSLYNSKIQSSKLRKNKRNQQQSYLDHNQLSNIQSIIDQIELFMQKSVPIMKASKGMQQQQYQQKYINKNKKKATLTGSNKNMFRNQWKQSFNKINKLDQMIIGYKTTEDPYQKYKNDKKKQQLQESIQFGQNNSFGYKQRGFKNQDKNYQNEYLDQENQFNQHLAEKGQQPITLIILVRWQALPVVPIPFKDILLKFPSYPQQSIYQKLIKKVLEKGIIHFSIFYKHENVIQNIAGLGQNEQNQSLCLLSQEQYAMKWESIYTGKDILNQQQTQSLMEYDIQWYRTIVDFIYKGGLEEVIQRENGYDINKYIKLIKQLSQNYPQKNSENLIDQNRIDFVKNYSKTQYFQTIKEKQTKYYILATKVQNKNHANKIKQSFPQTFTLIGQHNLTLSIFNLSQSSNNQYKMNQSGDIIIQERIGIRVKQFDQQGIQSQKNIGQLGQQVKVIFEVVPIKQNDDLQVRIKKIDTEDKVEQVKLKDQAQFGKVYAIYPNSN